MGSRELAQSILQDFALLVREGAGHSLKGVSGGEFGVLSYIHYMGGGVTPSDISQELRVSTARVANVLNALERKNHVERRRDPSDRRKVRIFATDNGRKLTERYIKHAMEQVQTMMELLGEEDAAEAARLMGRIREIYEERWVKAPTMGQEVHT